MIEFRPSVAGDRAALSTLWREAFGDSDDFICLFFDTAYAPERSRVASEHGRINAMLFWFDCTLSGEKAAYLYAVATDPREQGKGISTALLEDTRRHLAQSGYRYIILSPGSEALFRFYEKRGYRTAGFISEGVYTAGTPIPVRQITPEEYAAARRAMLPPNGVYQEGENLRFLREFARFYAGEGFLAAVSRQEDFIPEFLGNSDCIPGLLAALGLGRAAVRRPGDDRALVMLQPLGTAHPQERIHFGFPFD